MYDSGIGVYFFFFFSCVTLVWVHDNGVGVWYCFWRMILLLECYAVGDVWFWCYDDDDANLWLLAQYLIRRLVCGHETDITYDKWLTRAQWLIRRVILSHWYKNNLMCIWCVARVSRTLIFAGQHMEGRGEGYDASERVEEEAGRRRWCRQHRWGEEKENLVCACASVSGSSDRHTAGSYILRLT